MINEKVAKQVLDDCEVMQAIILANKLQNVDVVLLSRLANQVQSALQSEVALQLAEGRISLYDVQYH